VLFGQGAPVEFDARGAAAGVELDGDHVYAPVGVGGAVLFEIRSGGGDEVGAFDGGDRLFREAEGATAARLDLDEHEGIGVPSDDVDLALAGAEVRRENAVAEPVEVEAGSGLACAGGAAVSGRRNGRYSVGGVRPRISRTGLKLCRCIGVGPLRLRVSRWEGVAYPLCSAKP